MVNELQLYRVLPCGDIVERYPFRLCPKSSVYTVKENVHMAHVRLVCLPHNAWIDESEVENCEGYNETGWDDRAIVE